MPTLTSISLASIALLLLPACSGSQAESEPATPATTSPTPPARSAKTPVSVAKGTPPFVGKASCSDRAGDVRFPNDGADLLSVDVGSDGDSLVIRFRTAADPAAQPRAIEWRVEAFEETPETDMRHTQFFIVSYYAGGFRAVAAEQGPGASGESAGTATIEDGVLVARFPFNAITDIESPTLAPPFKWAALTSGSQISGDYCPDRATPLASSDEVVPFPN